MKTKYKSLIILFTVFVLSTCIDPYKPKLKGYDNLLVVEGLITNEKVPYEIRLSRTNRTADASPDRVSDAVVFITDEKNHKTILTNSGGGLYLTDTLSFIGSAGKTYILNIITSDGKEYMSEPNTMLPVSEIDSIYYDKEKEFVNNQSEAHSGIRIYIDSKQGVENNKYYRWEFEETWKFSAPMPKKYDYVDEKNILPVVNFKKFCWKQQKSNEILISSVSDSGESYIKKQPLTFISPDISDRLSIQYSILVKQYSISKREYDFWDKLKKVNEINGDIFGTQPFPVTSNIYNVHNPDEQVLGYFQVSSVKQKRKYVTFSELLPLELPFYHYNCERIETSPEDYCRGVSYCIPPTWDELYRMWIRARYNFIEPYYDSETTVLKKLIFASPICSDCELSGSAEKPKFWIDLN